MEIYWYDKKNLEFKKIKTNFIYLWFVILMLAWNLLSYNSSHNQYTEIKYKSNQILKIRDFSLSYMRNAFFEKTIEHVKKNKWSYKDRKKLNKRFFPYIYNIVKNHSHVYLISDLALTGIILTIAQTETGNEKGEPFSSLLFRKGNNIGGLKGKGLDNLATFEYINNEKVYINCSFQKFNSVEESVLYILNLWETKRYESLHSTISYKHFFNELGNCGYFTFDETKETNVSDIWIKYYQVYFMSIFIKK